MAGSSSNDDILHQLKLGIIDFEISSSPVPLVSTHFPRSPRPFGLFTDAKPRLFARIGNLAGSGWPALKKVERFSVRRVAGMDAACFVPCYGECFLEFVVHTIKCCSMLGSLPKVLFQSSMQFVSHYLGFTMLFIELRQRTIFEILGGDIVADVMLWREKKLTMGILVVILAAWVVFEISGYTLLSLSSNRLAPPLPHLHLSEEMLNEAATFICDRANAVLSASEDIALGRDSRMFIKVGLCLFIISVIEGLIDFLTLGYMSLVLVLTVPALYERYE